MLRVCKVCERATVDVCVVKGGAPNLEIAWRKTFVGPSDGSDCAINNGLVRGLVEALICDLRQQVVQPSAWPTMRVSPRYSHVLRTVHGVLAAQLRKRLQYSMSYGSVARLCVEDKVCEAVGRFIYISNDESARVETLSDSSPLLGRVRVSHEVDLNYRPCDVRLSDSDQVLVSITLVCSVVRLMLIWTVFQSLEQRASPSSIMRGIGSDGYCQDEGEDKDQTGG